MKLLNVGCGFRYSKSSEWVNVDMASTGEGVIAHNLKNGIPFADNSFDLVYHSHVFEHIPKQYADAFIKECVRVLKPGGVLRIVVPDLEQIVLNYLRLLENGVKDRESAKIAADYDWITLEMYDQTVRNTNGGQMMEYLLNPGIINKEFVLQRCGQELKQYFRIENRSGDANAALEKSQAKLGLLKSIYGFLINKEYRKTVLLKCLLKEDIELLEIGKFRQGGEIHQWMYDRYSVGRIMEKNGLKDIKQQRADESFNAEWKSYNLDTEPDGSAYKPDSLYMEAIK